MRPSDAARLLALGAIWGSSFMFIKVALDDFGPMAIVTARLVLAVAVLFPLLRMKGLKLPSGRVVWLHLGLMAVVSNVVPFFLIAWGEETISSSLAAILNSTTPLFTALIATVLLMDERLTPLRAAGIITGFAGVGVIVGLDMNGADLPGQIAVVFGAAAYATGFAYARRHLGGHVGSPLSLSAAQLMLAAMIALPFGIASIASETSGITVAGVGSLLVLGVVGTAAGYLLYYRLIHDVGATTASFATFLMPVFGVVLGVIFLSERLGWNTFAGAVLVGVGIWVAERGARRGVVDLAPPEAAGELEGAGCSP